MKKIFLPIVVCLATAFNANAVDAGNANIYASGLKVLNGGSDVQFVLNAPGDVTVNFYKEGVTDAVYSISKTGLEKGTHTLSLTGVLPDAVKEGDQLSWEVVASAEAKTAWVGFSAKAAGLSEIPADQLMQYPYSVTVNKNPQSSTFGNIYMLNSTAKSGKATLEQGVYAYNSLLAMLNDDNGAYTGNIEWKSSFGASGSTYYANQPLSPFTIKTDEEGNIYLSEVRVENGSGGVYLMNSNDPFSEFTRVVKVNGTWIYDICVLGTGENKTLYALDETSKSIVKYELADLTNLPYTTSETFCDLSSTGLQHDGSRYMCPDKKGGLWIIQRNRDETETNGSFKLLHVNKSGNLTNFSKVEISETAKTIADGVVLLDYNSSYGTKYSNTYSRHMIGMDCNSDGTKLAIGVYAAVGIYDIKFDEDGSIVSIKKSVNSIEKGESSLNHAVMSVAFDVADNLYVADWSDYFQAYAMPKAENKYTTPANERVTVSKEMTGVESTIVDENAPVEYFNMQGVKVNAPENGIFIKKQAGKTSKVIL